MNYAALGVRDSNTTIQVLFEISSAVSKADNLDELYKVIHKSLGRLLNVDNFFIALYHEDKDSITFPYYVDEIDKDIGEVFEVTSKQSLTANVINQGRALLATEADLMRMASQNSGELIGTPCKVWVGAPLKIKDKAFGALVLQSYTSRNVYKESDLDLLTSVSDFVAISIDRKRAEKAQQESEDINRTLFEISRAVNTTENLSELFESIYSSLNRIIDITNFYIALYEKETNKIIFPFHYDEYDNLDEWNITYLKTDSLTNEVFQALKPVLLTKKELEIRAEQKRIVGTTPLIWLGVPLLIRGEIKGVMVTQSYSDPKLFDQRDVDILNSVSEQIAMAIERKQSEENIRQNEKLTKTLFRISNAINITDKLDDLYQSIYDSLNILISLPNFFISIVEEDKRLMHFPLYIDEYDEDNISFTVDYSETSNYITADVIRSKKPLFLKKK
ncbi:MAG: GAF domain-containing protein, partial [Desulfobacula sp.]|nr:GAF domain-containing protein [Desulfobacula sp.]